MKKWKWITGLLFILTMVFHHTNDILAQEPLLIVTDQWPPYAFEKDGKITGADVETTKAVFQQLGIAVDIKLFPWKRCLMMVEFNTADAILDAAQTQERKKFLTFPEEPVSEGTTCFFTRSNRTIPFTGLADLKGLRIGTIIGYSYCDELDHSLAVIESEQVLSLKQNFQKLMAGRIDIVVEADKVGYYTAMQMGISDQITTIPNAKYCYGGNYLAFSKQPGSEQFASKFSQGLKAFKKTASYKAIQRSYGFEVSETQ